MPLNKTSAAPARRLNLGPLWLQVLVGMVLGIVAGMLVPHQAVALRPLGDLSVRLIRMMLPPLMFLSITIGIARLGDLRLVGASGSRHCCILRPSPLSRWLSAWAEPYC